MDDHVVVRLGLGDFLQRQGWSICGEAASAEEALRTVVEARPDLVVTDISLPKANGIELVKALASVLPGVPVLVFTIHDEQLYARRALAAGARGYVMKDAPPDEIAVAVRAVLAGGAYVGARTIRGLVDEAASGGVERSRLDTLTDRELEVFARFGEGLTTRQIADLLHLSVKTVENHRASIKRKLGLQHASQVIQHATLWRAGALDDGGIP